MKQVLFALGALVAGVVMSQFWHIASQVQASVSSYTASDFSQYCASNSSICNKVDFSSQTGSVSCPSGSQTIDKVYVHAGDGQTVYEMPDAGFQVVYSNNNNTVQITADPHPHNLSWIGVVCSDPQVTPTPTPTPTTTSTPTPTPTTPVRVTPTPTATPTPSISVSKIRKTFMCYDQSQGAYWRIRNDGNAVSGTITWKINQSSLTDIGTLNPGEAVFFYTKECGVLTVYENGISKGTATCNTDKICEATPTPTPTVEVTPTVTPTPGEGLVAGLGYEVPCEKDEVSAKYHVTDNGQPVEGITVTFDYNGHKKDATTNSDGYAIAVFGKDGENMLVATANGFNKIETKVQFPTNCESTGEVLGATTEMKGQVLGYASTGVTGDLVMQLSGVLGTLMVSAGALMHAKQK